MNPRPAFHPVGAPITQRVVERSARARGLHLRRIRAGFDTKVPRRWRSFSSRTGASAATRDGVTQRQVSMEPPRLLRDVMAMALTHRIRDAALHLGARSKIMVRLPIGSLNFGHLPAGFALGWPTASGMANDEKARICQRCVEGGWECSDACSCSRPRLAPTTVPESTPPMAPRSPTRCSC